MSAVRQIALLVAKDLRIEWRGRARLLSVLLFGVITLLIFSIAAGPTGPDSELLSELAGGFLVVALLLSSTLGLSESFRIEREDMALEGLLLLPAEPAAIYYSKMISNSLFLGLLAPILMPIAVVLYDVPMTPARLAAMAGLWLLAAIGLSAPGTLYAAMTSSVRGQDVLLPLLLFPLVVPVLMATVRSFDLVLNGDPMEQLRSWVLLLVGFDVIYGSVCGVLFPLISEESS